MNKSEMEALGIDHIQLDCYDRNSERVAGNELPCDCCGRKVAGYRYSIAMIAPGDVVPADFDHEAYTALGGESMGCYPIGPECRKKYPAEYVSEET